MTKITESQIESFAIELLQKQGYQYILEQEDLTDTQKAIAKWTQLEALVGSANRIKKIAGTLLPICRTGIITLLSVLR